MKNINIEEVKRYLKRSLKNKVKITTSLIVLFMMSNSIVSGHVIVVNEGKIGSGYSGAGAKRWGVFQNTPQKRAIALNISATDENRVAHENVGSYSVAVGYEAKAKAENSVAIGRGSNIEDGATNSIAIGREAKIFKSDQIESNSNGDEDITERSIAIGRKAETKIYKSTAIGSEASAESALIYNPYVLEKYKAIYETFKNDITIKGEGYKFSKNDINSLKTKYLSKIEEQKREIAEIENKIKAIDNNTEKKKIFLGRQELNDQKNELIRKKHDLNINTETLKQIFEKKFAYLNDKNLEKKQVLNQFNDEKIITQGGEGVSIGSKTKAVDQATSIGNQTYAIGRSSIALGSDDNRYFTEKVTDEDKKHYFEGIYKVIDPNNTTYTPPNLRQYSPTLAAGDGGIAIGTRALSYGIGATSIGAFSYALGDYSTAMGAETRAEGYGAIAVGNKTKVFSDYAVAVGNENQVSQSGGLAYGFKAISSGRNTIAIGTDVYGNVNIDDSKGIHSKYKQINKNTSKVEDKLKNNINGRKKVHDEYDKIDETLKNLENSYTIDSSYSANDVDKKLKYNGVEEKTGKKVKEQNGNNAIVIGTNAVAKGNNSITLGHASFSMKDNSAAIGSLTYVDGKNSIGLGIGTRVFSDNSLAVGIGSVIARDSQNSLVFGNAAYVGSINSIALGNKASVTLDNSLALGNNSTTDYNPSWLNEKGYVPKGAISLPSSTNVGVISVGSIGQERRITNVAAGYRDTDAVNVSQLKSVEDKLSAVNLSGYDSSMVNFVSVNKTDGEGKKMQDLAIRMGNYKEYIQLKSKLLEIKVRKEKNHETINIEVEKEIEKLLEDEKYNDIKNKDESFKKFETQVTNKIKATDKATDILTEIDKKKDELIKDENLKSILNDEERKNFEKSNFYNKSTTGKDAIAIGAFADATKEQAVAIGKNAKGDSWSVAIGGNTESGNTAVAIGDRAKALGEKSVAIGHSAKANHNDSVAIGNGSEANSSTNSSYLTNDQNSGGRTFAVGGTDIKRRITGVADGSADSDAVTVKQLKKVGNIIFTGDTGSKSTFELIKNIDIKGATAKKQNNIDIETWGQGDKKHTVENIQTHVSKNGDTQRIVIGMKDVPRFTGIKLGNDSSVNLSVNNNNLTLNNKKLTGLADGDISTSSTDAVTGKQLEARTKFTIQADVYRENKTDNSNKAIDLPISKKIIFRGASKSEEIEVNGENGKVKKSVPKTYDKTHSVENVRTYIEKNENNDYEVIVAFKNKPKFDKVQIGEVGGFVISKNTEAFEFNKKKLGNVAPGRIGDKSGDVVVGDQLKDYVKQIDSSNDGDISVTPSDIKDGSNKVGVKYTLGLKQDLKDKINKIDDKADKSELTELKNKEITFIGDTRGAETKDVKVKLGEEIQIKAEDRWNFNKQNNSFDKNQDNYETENLSTYYRIKDGKKQILIGMKSKPNFEEINIKREIEKKNKEKEYKEAKIGINDEGKVTLTDAQNTTASPIVTEATVGNQKIKYTANNEQTKKETTLTNGFNFSDGTNTKAEVGDNGVVKFNLKDALTGITSIEKGTNGTKITLNENDITVNKKITGLVAGSEDSDAVNKKQLDEKASVTELNTLKATVTTNTSSIKTNKAEIDKKLNEGDLSITGDDYITVGNNGGSHKYTLSLKADTLGEKIDLSKNSTITDLTTKVTTNTNEIKAVKETVGKGIKFSTDNETNKVVNLGETISILGKNTKPINWENDYSTDNITTYYKENNNEKQIFIGLKKDPEFKTINLKEGDKQVTLATNNEGKFVIKREIIDKNTKNELEEEVLTTNNIKYQTIGYKANSKDDKKVSLKDGFNFSDGTNIEAKIEDNGVVKFNLKDELTGIKSIENGAKITLESDKITVNKKITGLADGTDSTDAVNKKQLDEKASATELNTLKGTVTTNTSSINTNKAEIAKKLNKDDLSITGDTYISVENNNHKYTLSLKADTLGEKIDLSKNSKIKELTTNVTTNTNDIKTVKETVGKGIKFKSDFGNEIETKLDGTLEIHGGKSTNNEDKSWEYKKDQSSSDSAIQYTTENVMTKVDDGKIYIGLKKNTQFESVTFGDNGPKLSKDAKNNLLIDSKKITGLADGTDSTDAVNKKQLDTKANRNASNLSSVNLKSWSDRLGHGKIEKDNKGLVNGKAVYDFVNPIIQTVDKNKESIDKLTKNILSQTIGYKANNETAKKVSLENGFTFKNTDNITSKANDNGEISFELNKDLKKISSIESDGTEEAKKTKVTLTENGTEFKTGTDGVTTKIGKDGVEITKGSKTVSITTTDKGGSITGLEDRKVSNSNYGEAGRVATEGAVKEIYDQLNSNNGVSNKLNELRRGLAGSVVYTDKDGNRVARANNGKVYSIEAVDENGELKVGHSYAKVIEPENVVLSTVNTDGKTTKPITIGNVASALGLSKDKKDNKGILDKLVNKTANPNIYTEKEFNKVVTLRDLQFLASKGITFAGSTGTATKFLGDTITINGSNTSDYKDLDKNNNFSNKYETKNIAVKVDNTNGNIEVGLAKELKNINSIESNETEKAKITLSKDKGIEFTTDDKGKTVTIKTTDKGGSITGLEEKTVDINYGTTEGEVATRKEVKSIYDKIKSTSSEVGKVTLTLTTDDNSATEKKVNLKKDKIKFASGINTKSTIEQDNTKNLTTVKYDINSELKGIKNISSDSNGNSTKLTLNDNELLINNKKIKGLAKGDLSENSTDAVTGGQVYEIKNKVDKLTINNYINFAGDNGDDIKLSLADKLSIVGEGNITPAKTAENNITVDSDKENKKLTVKLAKDLQNIGSVTFKQGDKTAKISIDNSGDLNITKNGDTKTEKILTTNNIGGQKIYYTSNSDTNKKETTLTTGFDFTSKDLEIKTGEKGKVTFNLTDTVKNSLNGKGNDGRDGTTGDNSAGSKGLTGKDGLNGKDITTKVNALRNGEAGTVVYTDKDGNRLVKANDGKYYKAEYVEDNGALKVGHSYAEGVKDISATLVNPDGSTKKPTTKLRIADGSISVGSKDAINGGQVYNKLKEYALKDASNIDVTNWVTKLGDDSLESGSKLAKSSAVKEYVDKIKSGLEDKGLTFDADKGEKQTQKLGSSIKIASATEEISDKNIKYLGKNIKTKITKTGEDSTISLAFSDSPEFSSVKIGDNGKTVTIKTTDKGGSITGLEERKVSSSNYGEAGRVATEGAVKEIYDQLNSNNGVSNKLNELRNGLAGTVVYTDKDGNKLVKLNGKFYKQSELKNGELTVGHSYDDGLDAKDIFLSTVNPDGSTTTPTTKLRVADGSISAGSKEAVTGGQVYEIKNKVDTLTRDNYVNFSGDSGNDIKISLAEKLSIVGEGDTTPAETAKNNITVQSEDNKLTVKLAKNLQNMKSFETEAKDGNKTTLNQDGLKIGNDTNAVTITNESITGLKDTSVDNTKYGQSGVVATQKEVKAVLNKVHSNEIEQKKIKDGLAGAVVYTDKDGNKLVKLNGKFYKQSELKNGELPVGSSYKDGIKEEDIFLSTVNSDGKTTKPITLGNVASALGLSKDSKNNNEILKKLINKEAKKDVYKDAELNKAVTLRDLQFLASKGITFAGSTGTANKYLGDTISINSKTSDYKDLNNGGFTTNYVTKNIAVKVDNTSGDIEIGLAKELKNIKSISSENDKSKIELTDSGLKLTDDNATLSIEKDGDNFKLSGLKDSKVDNGYGQSGVAATQKEVKEVLDKVNKNIKGQNDLKDGLAGTVIYTDKDGNKLVKVNGAYYKQSDVKDDGNIKDNATSISSDNIKVTLVGTDGSIDKGVTLGNLKSTLGLNKANNGMTEINKKSILSKLTGNENYSEKELDNAVSLRDLQFVAKTGLVFSGNSGSVIKPIGETVRIIGGAKLSEKILEDTSSVIDPKAKYSDNGKEDFEKNFTSSSIATRVNEEGNIQIGISKDIKDIRTIEFTKGENEKAIGKIKGLANGEISSTSNDAINGAQLNDILDKVGIKVNDDKTGFNTLEISEIGGKKPSNILEGLNKTIESVNEQSVGYKANNGKVETVKLKEGFNFVNGTNTTASIEKDGKIKYSLNKELKGIEGLELKNKDKKLSLAVNNKGEAVIRREESIQSTEKVITTDDKLKLKFKSSTASDKNEKVINIAKNEALDFKAGSNLTSKVSDGSIEYGLKSDLKGITSISGGKDDKSKIELTDSGLKLTNDKATLSIEKDGDNFKLSGLKDSDVNNGYGQSGVAATQKEVKDVLDKVNKNIKGQNDLKDGLAGTVIYTDKDGNKLVKVNGKFYKQSELKNGELPVGSSYKDGIKEKDIFLSTVNSDGSTKEPTTKLRIADGSISAGSKEAVTGGQVYELKNKIEDISKKQFIKIKGDTNDEQTLNLGDTLEVVGEGDTTPAETAKNNITVQADKNKLTVKLAKKLQNMKSFETEAKNGNKTTLNQDGLKIGNDTKAVKITNESITGLTERKVSGSDYGEKGRAATEGAVKEVYDKLNTLNQGLTFKANKGQTKKEIGKILGVLGGATLKEKLIEDRSSIIDPKAKSSDNGKEDFDTNYNSKNVATRVSEDNNIHIGVSKELKDMRSFETEKDGKGNSSKLNQKELSIIGKDGSINISNNEIKFDKNGGTISGLKGGKIEAGSTDAVSGGQVYEKLKTIDSHLNTNYYNKSKINEMIGEVDKKSTVALEKSELALGGVANAVAMANLVQVNSYSRHRHNLSAAYGYYGGSHALAVGFSGTNEERNFVYKLSGSVNNKGNLAFGVGAGVMLGEENENNYPEKVKKVSELENKVKKQEEEINKLKKQAEKTDMLEKQVAELMKLIKKKK